MSSRTPAIVGFLIGGAAILGLGFFFGNRERAPGDNVPVLSITAPQAGDTLRNPVALHFATTAPLELDSRGWTAHDMHLHLLADSLELMPAAADIGRLAGGFVWKLPPLPPGQLRLVLTWAGRNHGNLRGVTDTLHVHVLADSVTAPLPPVQHPVTHGR